ncbi:MAG: hypothetical protein AB1603_07525 [Chloroflexota bacterium]
MINKDNQNDTTAVRETAARSLELDVKEALLARHTDLTGALKEIDATISRVQDEFSEKLEQLQAQKRPLHEAMQHIEALLRFEGYYMSSNGNVDTNNSGAVAAGISITDAVFSLLEEIGQPTHYKDITSRLLARNIHIPGKDPAATLLSRINRNNRFKRTKKRGVYALSTWRVRRTKTKSAGKRRKTVGK